MKWMVTMVFLFGLITLGMAQPWTYDFGTGTGSHTTGASTTFLPDPPAGGGADARVRIGTTGGSFNLENPGLVGFGSGSELRGVAPTTTSVNKFSIYDYTASKTFTIQFLIRLGGGSSGTWYFFSGDGAQYSDNGGFAGAQTFTGLRWVFGASDAITTSYRSGGAWATLTGVMGSQNTTYKVDIYCNNSTSTVSYTYAGSRSVAPNTFDLYVDGSLVGDDLSKALLPADANMDSWMFYGESSTGNVATIYLDDIIYTNGIADAPLPVELSSFTAAAWNGVVTLRWVTQSEINNERFDVLRAQERNGVYQVIGSEPGQGNSNAPTSYSFADNLVANGSTYWYKIADVDVNGVRTEHGPVSATPQAAGTEIITINSDVPANFRIYPAYPNPFNPSTNLKFDIPAGSQGLQDVKVEIYNALGQKIRTLFEGIAEPATHSLAWDGADDNGQTVPGGVYFAVLTTGHFRESVKLTLVK